MYKMKADGVVFYDPSAVDMTLQVLKPKAKFELNKADTLTFVMLPGNVLYDGLQEMKSIVTLEQDDEVIFRGRVLETTTDKYNRKEVYCEGELYYLLDSVVRPYKFKGKAADLLRQLVTAHNEQVDEYKRFEVGIITAVDDEDEVDTDSEAYADTLSEIRQMLVTEFKGYLRIRFEDGVRYLDYIDEYDDECGQAVEFGVNLIDIENKSDAGDVFSVLVPLGGYNTKRSNDPLTIKTVNDGKDYIEDAEAIAKYGRIVKTYKWEEITDPQELLDKGLEHFENMKAARTLTIKAVDLHVVDASVDSIRLGKRVKLLSTPHGLNEPEICVKIDLDIEKPEETEYTFGLPLESLTDSNASKNKKAAGSLAYLYRQIWLKAGYEEVDELGHRVTSAEVKIDGVAAAVELKASKEVTDELGTRLTSAELRIDGAKSLIEAKADTVRVEALETEIAGLLKVEDLETETLKIIDGATIPELKTGAFNCSGLATVSTLYVGTGAVIPSLVVGGNQLATASLTMGTVSETIWSPSDIDLAHSHKVTVNDDGTVTLGEVSSTGGSFKIADTAYYKNGVSAAMESVTLSSAGWVNGTCIVNASNGKSHTVNLPPFSASGGTTFVGNKTTVFFYTDGISTPLKSVEVDATSVYDAGYAAGYQAAKDAVVVTAGVSWSNPAQNYARVSYWGRATIDGEQVGYYSSSDSKDISGYV